jgi:MoaA/NifB/PqqE/SkfB family radical SAM enzyme
VVNELNSWQLRLARGACRAEKSLPQELHLEITHRCDLKCRMCHHWRMKRQKKEITPSEIAHLLDNSKLLDGIKIAVLTGGEPLLRDDLAEIASVITKRFPKISLGILTNLSNSSLLFRRIEECRKNGVSRLWLGSSLDGVGAVNDAVRGVSGAYARTMRTAAELRAKYPAIDVSFNFTLLPFNAGNLVESYLAAKKMNIWFGAQKVVNHEGFKVEKYAWDAKSLRTAVSQIDWIIADICGKNNAFEKMMSAIERETPWLWNSLIYWTRLREYMINPRRFMDDCYAGKRYAMLSPRGELFFCPVRKHRTVGNALTDGFDHVWSGKNAETERKFIAKARCHCWLHCIANPIIDAAVTRRFAAKT